MVEIVNQNPILVAIIGFLVLIIIILSGIIVSFWNSLKENKDMIDGAEKILSKYSKLLIENNQLRKLIGVIILLIGLYSCGTCGCGPSSRIDQQIIAYKNEYSNSSAYKLVTTLYDNSRIVSTDTVKVSSDNIESLKSQKLKEFKIIQTDYENLKKSLGR